MKQQSYWKALEKIVNYGILTLWEPAYDTFVLWFRPKKQQISAALPTP